MTDKISSPSASSFSGSASTPLKGTGDSEDDTYLTIRKQPPSYVFAEEVFETDFALETRGTNQSPPTDLEVIATLQEYITKGSQARATRPKPTLVLLEGPPIRVSASRGTGKVRCKISSSQQKGTWCIRLSAKGKDIASVTTRTIHLVDAKVRVSTTDEWDSLWYKDEGGRDKSMEVVAEAYDKDNQLLQERIPLSVSLCYDAESPLQVTNQDILKTQGSERKLQLDKSTGRARIRFRIEDVSKNHQGQSFVVKINAEKKGDREIAPGFTPGVSVRSKRNKRHRASNSMTGSGRGLSGTDTSSPTMLQSSPIYGEPAGIALETSDTSRLREAMQEVMHWTDEVVNGLYSLQWQVLGYAQHPDGSPDYNRPYHSMPNPNPLIAQVLSRYTDSVRGNLRHVQQAIEQAPYSAMNTAVASLPREPEGMFGIMPMSGAQRARASPLTGPNHPRGMGPQGLLPLNRGPPPPIMHTGESPFRDFPPVQHHPNYYPPHSRPHDTDHMPMHPSIPQASQHLRDNKKAPPTARGRAEVEETRESEVEYVLAKQYKSMRTGDRLGFPAYSASKEILGFYRESSTKVGVGQFVPIRNLAHEFGSVEIMQATDILGESILAKSEAVHALKDWGSISSLIDHALVYDWSKDIDGSGNQNQSESSATLP